MDRRSCLFALSVLSLPSCALKGQLGPSGALVGGALNRESVDWKGAAVGSLRSLRLRAGFFFGHDVTVSERVTYVLDLSGSMGEESGTSLTGSEGEVKTGEDLVAGTLGGSVGGAAATSLTRSKKIELVKDHLSASIRGLANSAQFNVVLFSDGVKKLAPQMMQANLGSKTLVSGFVATLSEGGGTDLHEAMEAALDTPADRLILLTDGEPTDASTDSILELVRQRNADQRRTVDTVGVGLDLDSHFLSTLAHENGGVFLAYR